MEYNEQFLKFLQKKEGKELVMEKILDLLENKGSFQDIGVSPTPRLCVKQLITQEVYYWKKQSKNANRLLCGP